MSGCVLDTEIYANISPVVTAIADYLRCLHTHVVQELCKQFARNYTPEQFRYCLTVPAMWSGTLYT
jgi:hypothetical protein